MEWAYTWKNVREWNDSLILLDIPAYNHWGIEHRSNKPDIIIRLSTHNLPTKGGDYDDFEGESRFFPTMIKGLAAENFQRKWHRA